MPGGHLPSHRRQDLEAPPGQPHRPHLPSDAVVREQVAGGALRARWQPHRPGRGKERPIRDFIHELIDGFLDDVLDELGSRKEVEHSYKILEEGSSADRQLAVFAETGDLTSVVDHLIAETAAGCLEQAVAS